MKTMMMKRQPGDDSETVGDKKNVRKSSSITEMAEKISTIEVDDHPIKAVVPMKTKMTILVRNNNVIE